MTPKALEARKAYKREWARKNPEKVREYQSRYWSKKAAQAEQAAEQASRSDPPHSEGGGKA